MVCSKEVPNLSLHRSAKRISHNTISTLCAQNSKPKRANASRDYDPSPNLEKINVPLLAINSADDEINPPELCIIEKEIKRVKPGHFVLLPISDQTRGHGTHSLSEIWKQYLAELLEESKP